MMARDGDARVFAVHNDDVGRRLDRVLRKLLPRASLDRIYTALRKREVAVDGEPREGAYRLAEGQSILLRGPLAAVEPSPASTRTRPDTAQPGGHAGASTIGTPSPADHIIPVLYRNEHMVVFDKPRGLPVHGQHSVATLMADHLQRWSQVSLSFRPGPVHRLDRDTTGIVLFALSLAGARELSALLRDRACQKIYFALLTGEIGVPEDWQDTLTRDRGAGRSVADPAGLDAQTQVVPLGVAGGQTLAQVRIITGRTHQIRAQASLHGHPLVGDTRYGGAPNEGGYVLHCARFTLPASATVTDRTRFVSPLPAYSRQILDRHLGADVVSRALRAHADNGGVIKG